MPARAEAAPGVIKEHKAIIFNGDGYSEAWHKEAAKRGLPNLRNTVDALEAVSGDKAAAALFEKYNVLTKRELACPQRDLHRALLQGCKHRSACSSTISPSP
jgi:glutamine synthetase